ncbi:hypothetical protein [Chromobacterium violaceum]|uniref:bpX5 domain-containing protein n=1 Tax=Chromobacterium violaceum TaxID=536 RepID=UPI0005D39583|nr:hypothetical protein [Chromobacterium violaceum]KJH68051.1 hypothetical protein UF16_06990 [Chromobacterium violaceum]
MSGSAIAWHWQPVPESNIAAPQAAVAFGDAAERLLKRLETMPAERRSALMLSAGEGLLVALGPEHALPWVESVEYARPDDSVRQLWLPTKWQPDVSTDALATALNIRSPVWPMLLWRQPALIIPLNRQWPAGDDLLADIRRRWSGAYRS